MKPGHRIFQYDYEARNVFSIVIVYKLFLDAFIAVDCPIE